MYVCGGKITNLWREIKTTVQLFIQQLNICVCITMYAYIRVGLSLETNSNNILIMTKSAYTDRTRPSLQQPAYRVKKDKPVGYY